MALSAETTLYHIRNPNCGRIVLTFRSINWKARKRNRACPSADPTAGWRKHPVPLVYLATHTTQVGSFEKETLERNNIRRMLTAFFTERHAGNRYQ